VKEIAITAGQPLRVSGYGTSISIAQAGCKVNLHNDDVVNLFDAVAEVLADNRRFAERHHKARHTRKPRKGKTEQHAEPPPN
jgi:hypothetical protein